jgi:hypothetical protein
MVIMNKPKKRTYIEAFGNNFVIPKIIYKKLKLEYDENTKK